jgi:predicted permease
LGHGDNSGAFWFGPQPPASIAEIPRAVYYPISPDYPHTVQIPLLRGRLLTAADDVHSEVVVLIDSLMAHQYFAGRDPVGQTLTIPHWGTDRGISARIVGVVGRVRQYGIDGSGHEKPAIYFSIFQLPDAALPIFRDEITFAVRTRRSPVAILPDIKHAVYGSNRNEPVYNVHTMRELVSGSMASQRFSMILLVAFALLALSVAIIGLYGVISYSVAQRVPEIGIRMALGAEKQTVLRMLITEGFRLALTGVAIGVVAALTLTQIVASFSHLLYGVRAGDPLTFGAVSLSLIATALIACYIPARRAARVDPMIALRHD